MLCGISILIFLTFFDIVFQTNDVPLPEDNMTRLLNDLFQHRLAERITTNYNNCRVIFLENCLMDLINLDIELIAYMYCLLVDRAIDNFFY